MELITYNIETISKIRQRTNLFDSKTDEQLADLYHMWSEQSYSVSWLMYNEIGIEYFITWATTAPIDYA